MSGTRGQWIGPRETLVDLDAAQADTDSFFDWAEGYGQPNQANFAAGTKLLIAELRATRDFQQEAIGIITDLLDWMERKHGGDPALHPEAYYRSTEWARRFLDDHINALAGKEQS